MEQTPHQDLSERLKPAWRWRACFVVYSLGMVLLTVCIVNAVKRPPSLVVANFGPTGNERSAKTPHRLLVEYIDSIKQGREFRIGEATGLVHIATRHIGRRDIEFSENWVQWIMGQFYDPMLQTQDTEMLIDGRLGNCSDRCQILKTVAEMSGKRCRFVGLSGHVVLEIEIDGRWRVADPDYNVTFAADIDFLSKPENESILRRPLDRRYPKSVIDEYVRIIQTENDNLHLPVGSPLSPRLYLAERVCQILAWVVPCLCLTAIIPLLRGPS